MYLILRVFHLHGPGKVRRGHWIPCNWVLGLNLGHLQEQLPSTSESPLPSRYPQLLRGCIFLPSSLLKDRPEAAQVCISGIQITEHTVSSV